MKNKSKIVPYALLAAIIGVTSCAPPTQQQINQQKIIDEIKSSTLSIPNATTGAVSGSVSFLNPNLVNNEIKVKVVRQVDIGKTDSSGRFLDITGKEFKDPKTQTQAFLERKGDVISTEILDRSKRSFLLANFQPGDVIVNVTSGSESVDVLSKIQAGRVTQLPPIVIGSPNKAVIKTGINIKGRVLRPDGTPVANATVSDVTQNVATVSTKTNAQGEFILQVNSFNKPKNLEVVLDKLSTSTTVNPDQIDDVVISLVANSRVLKGVLLDSINKKPIANIPVRSIESNSSTSTNAQGEFIIRGVSTTFGTLEFGPQDGYVLGQTSVPSSTENETNLGNIDVRPLGNVLINIVADNFPDPINFPVEERGTDKVPELGTALLAPYKRSVDSISAISLLCSQGTSPALYYVSNPFFYKEAIKGTLQIEGTDIKQNFEYPTTPTLEPAPKCKSSNSTLGDDSYTVTVYTRNRLLSIPVNNLPGGEYTVSVSLDFHETQKGIRVVVPSKDTISTELIQMRRVKRILSLGDIIGNIIIKDANGANPSGSSSIKVRVLALRGEVDLRDKALLKRIFSKPQEEITTGTGDSEINNLTGAVSSFGDVTIPASSNNQAQVGQYVLRGVPSGTRVVIAGVISESGELDTNYLISSYSSLNVVSSSVNKAPDNVITRR